MLFKLFKIKFLNTPCPTRIQITKCKFTTFTVYKCLLYASCKCFPILKFLNKKVLKWESFSLLFICSYDYSYFFTEKGKRQKPASGAHNINWNNSEENQDCLWSSWTRPMVHCYCLGCNSGSCTMIAEEWWQDYFQLLKSVKLCNM